MNLFTKQPADVLDYDLDFSDWLTGTDVLTGVVATASGPEDLQIQSASIVGQTAKIWISGGISGSTYKVTATISTSEGRVKQLEFKIRVRDL
jgi:hypothetical protein